MNLESHTVDYLLVADTHVHVYPCYSLEKFFAHASENLDRLIPSPKSPNSIKILMLTERYDCHFFKNLKAGKVNEGSAEREVEAMADENALRIKRPDTGSLILVAGRQVVSAERIEILALTADADIPDGLTVMRVLERIHAAGAVPVLSWAPGKWLGSRGRIIKNLVRQYHPGDFLMGDTALRPFLWPEPGLMRRARDKGFAVLAGSDPLPFAGEEKRVGQFGVAHEGNFNPEKPAESLRKIMLGSRGGFARVGIRGGLCSTLLRLRKNTHVRRSAG